MKKLCKEGKSSNEKYMFSMLSQLDIDFEIEFSPKWCKYTLDGESKSGRYDFYFELNGIKYIIEMDGEHHKVRKIHPRSNSVLKQNIIDDIKSILAERKGIEVIRIPCYKAKNIIGVKDLIYKSKLNDILNLDNVDWQLCIEEAYGSYIEKACLLKKQNQNLTTSDISRITKLSKGTIKKYLAIGNQLGWCYYNPKEEALLSLEKGREVQGTPICAYDENEMFVGVFKNSNHFATVGMDLFGIAFNSQNIRRCCNGGAKHHKKFSFKKTSRSNYDNFILKYKTNKDYLNFIKYNK